MNRPTDPLARLLRITTLVLVALPLLNGCAGLPRDQVSTDGISIEREDSMQARIGRVWIQKTPDGLQINGEIFRRPPGHQRIPGHLHIRLKNYDGNILTETIAEYDRPGVRSRQATFSVILPLDQRPAARLAIIHHVQPAPGRMTHESCHDNPPWPVAWPVTKPETS